MIISWSSKTTNDDGVLIQFNLVIQKWTGNMSEWLPTFDMLWQLPDNNAILQREPRGLPENWILHELAHFL